MCTVIAYADAEIHTSITTTLQRDNMIAYAGNVARNSATLCSVCRQLINVSSYIALI
jgi:hypothetical protein